MGTRGKNALQPILHPLRHRPPRIGKLVDASSFAIHQLPDPATTPAPPRTNKVNPSPPIYVGRRRSPAALLRPRLSTPPARFSPPLPERASPPPTVALLCTSTSPRSYPPPPPPLPPLIWTTAAAPSRSERGGRGGGRGTAGRRGRAVNPKERWAASSTSSTSSSGGGGEPEMDRRLLEAASCGDSRSMQAMASQDPSILLGRTPRGSSCLHISCIHGHTVFCTDVVALEESLLTAVNLGGETPLITAVTCGRVSLASLLLGCYREQRLSEAILQQDMDGCNALHHAIRSGHKDLALELIAAEPALSRGVNKYNESPMFVAVMRDFTHVFEKLLEIPDSGYAGQGGSNALHAAFKWEYIATKVMEKRPWLAREAGRGGNTPTRLAVHYKKIDVLQVLLEHDTSLGYEGGNEGVPLLNTAALQGHVAVARELLKHCPDAPNRRVDDPGWTCLHIAVETGQMEFVEFILETQQLGKLVNMRNNRGKTALHLAVQECNPKIVAALLSHKDIDTAVRDNGGATAAQELWSNASLAKSLNWNQVCMLMSKADPREANALYNLRRRASRRATKESRKEARSLTQTYTSNTSLVAILIVTITFAAAFTMPGGYSNDAGTEGLPIMSRKFAFQAFLISDTLAMCSSFAVAFICIIARWEDYEFLIYYRTFTKKLMWFAYVATTTAFATGLYTVLAPRLHWLAIAICFLVALLPILTKLLGEWPVLKLKIRPGQAYKSDLLDMV